MSVLRFALDAGDGTRSPAWSITTGAQQSDVYLRREGAGSWIHLSLHRAGWYHIKLHPDAEYEWTKPLELAPGITRVLEIAMTHSLCDGERRHAAGMSLVPLVPKLVNRFDVFLEVAAPDEESWPGRDAKHTELVGRLPLVNGQTCTVVTHPEALAASAMEVAPDPRYDMDEIRRGLAERTHMNVLLWGLQPDGTLALIDGRGEVNAPESDKL